MRAIQIKNHGGPDVLELVNIERKPPGKGEVCVKLEAAGLNYIDTYQRSGLYDVNLPYVPGLEGAGTVAEVGTGVTEFSEGERVTYTGVAGSYAEYINVPAERLVRVPDGVTLEDAAAVMLQGMTAQYLVDSTYPLKEGDTCLIHAVAGGVGLLFTQMAKMRGARVIGTTSSEEKAARARAAGADEIILYTQEDFEAEVKRLTEGEGVEVVYDSVGKTTFEKSLNCLKPRGLLALFGQSSGPVGDFDPQVLNQKGSLFLTRPSLFHYIATRDELVQRAGEVLAWVAEGKLEVHIDSVFTLNDAGDAHRKLESRQSSGKILLKP